MTAGLADALADLAAITPDMARELALAQKVCVRPLLRRVRDRSDGTEQTVALPCGATRDEVCPPCAHKARVLRMQQCAEGWHRTDEPEHHHDDDLDGDDEGDELDLDIDGDDQGDELDLDDDGQDLSGRGGCGDGGGRLVRSTRRRDDVAALPRVPAEERTVGRVFTAPNGQTYRPSMFLTVTMPSYGEVSRSGAAVDPQRYDYRRQAVDALLFARLVDRFWQNLRRVAGYRVQYFAAVEPQHRLTPHLHAAIRGTIPRSVIRQVVDATYVQVWWPDFTRPVYVRRPLAWDGANYYDPDTGEVLPVWREAVRQAKTDGVPPVTVRFGTQVDMAGIIAPSLDADRAVRYLTKYLTKSMSTAHQADDETDPGYAEHLARLVEEVRWLPCSPGCANWLRYGVQPQGAGPGMRPGHCPRKAHDSDHVGVGGRRVLVSRLWTGKTLAAHRADRADVVRQTLLTAGVIAPDTARLAATVTLPDGRPRFEWTDHRPDPRSYTRVLLAAVAERMRWRQQYDAAKTTLVDVPASAGPVDNCSATGPPAAA